MSVPEARGRGPGSGYYSSKEHHLRLGSMHTRRSPNNRESVVATEVSARDFTNHIVDHIGKVLPCLPGPCTPPHPHLPLQDVIPRSVRRCHFVPGLGALDVEPHRVCLAPVFFPPENLDRDHFIVVLWCHHRRETEFDEIVYCPHGLRGVC